MVISFSSKKARQQLLKWGYVYTFRKNRRKAFILAANRYWRMSLKKWGHRDWANIGRTEAKMCDVVIFEVGKLTLKRLGRYVKGSGFESLEEWGQEIAKMNRWKEPRVHDTGYLYKVLLVKEDG